MCEASTYYPFREAQRGDITQVGTVPGYTMKGLFEADRPIIGGPSEEADFGPRGQRALLVCARRGALLFIERINFILSSRMHNSEFANGENVPCRFHTERLEFGEGDGFKMHNGVLIPLTEITDGTRVRIASAFV